MDSDNNQIIELLNADIYGEHDAILYYLTHAWTVARQYGHEILEIAYDEMRHFKWLAHTIVGLGGRPVLRTPQITSITTIAAALQNDVDAEIHAIEQYEEHREIIPNPEVKALLARIITDERHHLHIFRGLLDQTHGEPEKLDRQDKDVSVIASRLQSTMNLEYQQTMAYLLRSFVENHSQRIGLDMEERSIDEMHHMGWIGKMMGQSGLEPRFAEPETLNQVREGTREEEALFHDVREWANRAMPGMVPTIDRILEQEHYHIQS